MTKRNGMVEVYEAGVLIGHYALTWSNDGKQLRVFIPDRDEDIRSRRRTFRTGAGDYACNNLNCGDVVHDVEDVRHEGRIVCILSGTARVRWIETGWESEVSTHNLRRV